MKNDPIVDEVRNNGLALVARFNNNIEAICKALKERELSSGRMTVNRAPHRVSQKSREKCTEERGVSIGRDRNMARTGL